MSVKFKESTQWCHEICRVKDVSLSRYPTPRLSVFRWENVSYRKQFCDLIRDCGRDPFNQNFRKFRSKTWMDGFGPTGNVSKKAVVDHFSRLGRSNRNGPLHLTIPTHSQSQDLAVRYLLCTKWRKILMYQSNSPLPGPKSCSNVPL